MYCEILDGTVDHFELLRNYRWSVESPAKARDGINRVMAHVWLKFIHYYLEWPWPLFLLVDDRVSELRMASVSESFCARMGCCTGEGIGAHNKTNFRINVYPPICTSLQTPHHL